MPLDYRYLAIVPASEIPSFVLGISTKEETRDEFRNRITQEIQSYWGDGTSIFAQKEIKDLQILELLLSDLRAAGFDSVDAT